MMIRRIAKNLFSTDWNLAINEILLVTVGILLALTIEDWWQGQERQDEEAALLARLADDIAVSLTTYDEAIAFNRGQREKALLAATSIERGSVAPGEEEAFEQSLIFAAWRGNAFVSATYTELISGGKIALIRDDTLRHDLASLGFHMKRVDLGIGRVGDGILGLLQQRNQHINLTWANDTLALKNAATDYLGNQPLQNIYYQLAYLYQSMNQYQALGRKETAALQNRLKEMGYTADAGAEQ